MALVHAYSDALGAFRAAVLDLQAIAHQLKSFGERIESFPDETCFVDIDEEETPRLDDLMPGGRWYAPEFPTPATIQAALCRRYLARARAIEIFNSMTPQQQKGVPPVPRA